MPTEYSATMTLLSICDLGEDRPNQCQVEVPESPDPIPAYGLVKVDGSDYYTRSRHAYVTTEYTALVDTYPHFPDMKFVTKSFPDGLARMYQFDKEGTLCQCYEFPDMAIRMTLPEDFLLYPLGDVGDNLYRYRLSYMGIKGHVSDGEEWIHIDYFEDNTTFMPKALIGDNNILQVDAMLTGDSMEYFSDSGFDISDNDFSWCKIATEVVQTDRHETYVKGESVITKNATLSEKKKLEDEEAAWEWTSKPYPPVYASPASLGSQHLYYFAEFHTFYNETADYYTGLDDFGVWIAAILNIEPEELILDDPQPIDLNPNGTYYVPYNSSLYYGNITDLLLHTTSFAATNITWTEPQPVSRALGESGALAPVSSSRRNLGVSFSIDPFAPSISIELQELAIVYTPGYEDGEWFHLIALEGEGCFLGVLCLSGSIDAMIKDPPDSVPDISSVVSLDARILKWTFNIITLRYNFYGGNYDYDGYILSKGTHIVAVERVVTVANQVRGSAGFELAMSKKKVKKNDPNWVRYNAGSVKFYAKAEYFKGIGEFGLGTGWETAASFSQNLYSWGAWGESRSWVLARCDASSFVELPIGTYLSAPWRASVGDVYAVLTSAGNLVIRMTVDGKEEHVWTSHTPSPTAPSEVVVASFDNFLVLAIRDFVAVLELREGAVCKHRMSSTGFCLDPAGNRYPFSTPRSQVAGGPAQTRWRLYADGNMKLEYTVVMPVPVLEGIRLNSYYQRRWATAWESGVRGPCALKANARP